MKATLPYITSKFKEFNDLIFEGKLSTPPIRVSCARKTLGKIRYTKRSSLFGREHYSDIQLLISNYFDLDEKELEDTIIHEMIHYYIVSNNIHDTSSHGTIFKEMMSSINSRFGRHITISHKLKNEERDEKVDSRPKLVCISTFKDGRRGVTVASQTRLNMLMRTIPHINNIVECKWYISRDPFYCKFPRALTPKVYIVPVADIDNHCADFVPLK